MRPPGPARTAPRTGPVRPSKGCGPADVPRPGQRVPGHRPGAVRPDCSLRSAVCSSGWQVKTSVGRPSTNRACGTSICPNPAGIEIGGPSSQLHHVGAAGMPDDAVVQPGRALVPRGDQHVPAVAVRITEHERITPGLAGHRVLRQAERLVPPRVRLQQRPVADPPPGEQVVGLGQPDALVEDAAAGAGDRGVVHPPDTVVAAHRRAGPQRQVVPGALRAQGRARRPGRSSSSGRSRSHARVVRTCAAGPHRPAIEAPAGRTGDSVSPSSAIQLSQIQ